MDNPTEKYALIYEFNNDSPLFARVANQYISAKKYQEAMTILEKGIFNYPEYPTAYFLYAIALANCGDSSQAVEMLRKGAELHGTSESLKYYTDLIENIVPENDEDEIVIEEDENHIVIEEDQNEIVIEDVEDEIVIEDEENKIVIEDNKNDMDDELEILAEKLSNAVMPKIDDNEDMPEEIKENDTPFHGKNLVSETLAKIYSNQGNYKQALSIYETLIDIQPEKKDYYNDLIAQIKDKI